MTTSIRRRPFGKTPDGERVDLFVLDGQTGVETSILTYGAALQALLAPDRDGHRGNVSLGFATLAEYVENTGHYFGATVGRYANRIAGARFALDGIVHEVDRNDGQNCLHGGAGGFDTRVWDVVEAADGMLRLTYSSPDGEMGFPGNLDTRVEYRLEGAELRIDYEAATSAATVVNLTNHTCWNLAGEGSGSVAGHVLTLNASAFTPVDANLVPTGEIRPVDGTPLDFRVPMPIGARGHGYDHNLVVDRRDDSLVLAAHVLEPASGRTLEVLTTEPGLQLYTGTSLDGSLVGMSGRPYRRGDCIALEAQHFPDSPNRPAFPSTVLLPGETFRSTTVFRFGRHQRNAPREFERPTPRTMTDRQGVRPEVAISRPLWRHSRCQLRQDREIGHWKRHGKDPYDPLDRSGLGRGLDEETTTTSPPPAQAASKAAPQTKPLPKPADNRSRGQHRRPPG